MPSGAGAAEGDGRHIAAGESGESGRTAGASETEPRYRPAESALSHKAVLEAPDITRALTRIAHEILERTKGGRDVVLLGIPTRGVTLARRLAERIGAVEGHPMPWGSLDVTMYRDDLRMRPARALGRTELPPDGVDGKVIVLVDDVLFSGRTVRAAHVGKNLPTSQRETVKVLLTENDGRDTVLLGPK